MRKTLLSLLFLAAAQAAAQQPIPPEQAAALLQSRPDLAGQLRQRIGASGLSPAQVRDRLRAQGYDPSLLDAYMSGEGAVQATPGSDVLDAVRALGLADADDVAGLKRIAKPATPSGKPVEPAPVSGAASAPGLTGESSKVFGMELFRTATSQFLPNLDGPVDPQYKLGPGDQLVLILTGDVELAHTLDVTREGFVVIPQVGRLGVASLTLAQLENLLYNRLGRVYSGVKRGGGTTQFSVSVARLRSVQVFVVGDVTAPGAYRISSAGTALTALYAAGGPTDRGTLRGVELRRGGRVVSRLDVYDYLLRGDASQDLRLQSGDVLFVGVHGPLVRLDGEVTRPATYELKNSESLADLISAAGGYTATAAASRTTIERIVPVSARVPGGRDRVVLDVALAGAAGIRLENGDIVSVPRIADRVRGRVVVNGAVWQAGSQGMVAGLTLTAALRRAGGLKPDGFLGQVLVSRLRPDSTRVQLRATLRDTTGAGAEEFALEEDDEVTVYSRTDFRLPRFVAIGGAVKNAGRYAYRDGMTMRDLVLQAGGLTESVNLDEAEIARVDGAPGAGTAASIRVALDSSYLFENGNAKGSTAEIALQAFDNVVVFPYPGFARQRLVTLTGEVKFPGTYALKNRAERLSDLVTRAGGITTYGDAGAAVFTRSRNQATFQSDDARLLVGVDLTRAIARPGNSDDLILQDGDAIAIPTKRQTVEIQGAVNSPTALAVAPGQSLGYYIRAGGGASTNADSRHAFVRQPNGKVEVRQRMLWVVTVDPKPRAGATVIVPAKGTERERASLVSTIAILAQSLAAIAAVIAVSK
ncbi:MAG: SLBB domain-containing protein [Gemmatimonadaceae bacterium]|nr:SLBB domain-containing protein [Gemmatimonadaceae bacterium]